MTYRGMVKDGMVLVEPPFLLPDGTVVDVIVTSDSVPAPPPQSLHDLLEPVIGIVDDLPEDSAMNIDHYLYGHPKK